MSDELDLPQTEILDSRLPQTELLPERAPTEILPDHPTAPAPASEQPTLANPPDATDESGDNDGDASPARMAELTHPLPLEELVPTAILNEPAPHPPTSPASPLRAPRDTPLINPAIPPLGSLYPTPAPAPAPPATPPPATPQRVSAAPPPRHAPAPENSGVVRAYWQRVNQPWRTQPEIPELRQLVLRRCLNIAPDIEHGDYPFLDVEPKLDRDDIEWLLAHHESAGATGPVDWSNENQRARRGLDLRGADLRGVDLSGLPLARARFGLSHTEWQRSTPDQRERAAAHLEGANLEGASLEHATLVGAHLEQARCVAAVLEGADLRSAHLARADFLEARLAEADLRGADLTETDLWKATLDRADLSQARLPKAVLREASLEHATLTQAQLQGADCIKAHLHHTTLTQADLTGADLHRAQLAHADLTGAVLARAILTHAQLTSADLSHVNAEEALLDETQFAGASFVAARLARVNLHLSQLVGANLSQADLRAANLTGAQLRTAILTEADLTGANLHQAQARSADFTRARLENADLRETQLREAILDHADLRGAKLAHADLAAARLGRATLAATDLSEADLTGADLRRAIFDAETDLFGVHIAGDLSGKKAAISIADLRWGDANLTVVDWSPLRQLGDEHTARAFRDAEGKPKNAPTRLSDYEAAVRGNRQLAAVLRHQGLSEQADRYAHRAQTLQRKVLLRRRAVFAYLGSHFLNLLAGYGYRPWRGLVFYILIVLAFAAAYMGLGATSGVTLSPLDAAIFSMLSFHGRGFVLAPSITLHSPITILAAVEALVGLIVEVGLIATLTQRFFGK